MAIKILLGCTTYKKNGCHFVQEGEDECTI